MTTTALVPGSLGAIAQRDGVSLAESFLNCDVLIIVDTSGSMDTRDSRGDQTRYQVALDELAALQAHQPGKCGVIAFSSDVAFCPGGQPIPYMQGTDLAKALRFAKVADVPGIRFIIISDGQPDSPQEALAEAARYQNRIDVVFVGSELSPIGRDFLQQLAQASGGQIVTADRAELLAQKTQLLLTA